MKYFAFLTLIAPIVLCASAKKSETYNDKVVEAKTSVEFEPIGECFAEYLYMRANNSGFSYAFQKKTLETPGSFDNRTIVGNKIFLNQV